MSAMASKITCLSIVYSTVCSDADQTKHQSPASLAFVRGIHRWPVNSPHKGPVTRKMFPSDDVIMIYTNKIPFSLTRFSFSIRVLIRKSLTPFPHRTRISSAMCRQLITLKAWKQPVSGSKMISLPWSQVKRAPIVLYSAVVFRKHSAQIAMLPKHYIDWLVLERRNCIASAMELRLSCTDPPILNCVQGKHRCQSLTQNSPFFPTWIDCDIQQSVTDQILLWKLWY